MTEHHGIKRRNSIQEHRALTREMHEWEKLSGHLTAALRSLAQGYEASKHIQIRGKVPDPVTRYKHLSHITQEAIEELRSTEDMCRKFQRDSEDMGETKEYQGKTDVQLDAETKQTEERIEQLRHKYYAHSDTLRELEAGYQRARQHNPALRYKMLKQIIKDATRQSGLGHLSTVQDRPNYGY